MKTRKNFRLPQELISRAETQAKEEGVTLTTFVENALQYYIDIIPVNASTNQSEIKNKSCKKEVVKPLSEDEKRIAEGKFILKLSDERDEDEGEPLDLRRRY